MALATTLMLVQAGASILQGLTNIAGTNQQSKYQKQILEKRKEYNLKQIQEAYELGYKNTMINYAEARQQQIELAMQGVKDTNIQISATANNVSITDSSFSGDIKTEMDYSLLENINSLLQSQENDINTAIKQKVAQELQLEQQYQDSLSNINALSQQQKQIGFSQLLSGSMAMYQGFENRQKDKEAIEKKGEVEVQEIRNFGSGAKKEDSWLK